MPLPRLEINHTRVRYFIVAALASSIFIYLVATSGAVGERTQSLSDHLRSSFSGPKYTDDELSDAILFGPSPIEYLPLEEAERWCNNHRYEIYPHRERPRKIYDLMLVNKELDWLEIRLGQMYDHVDYFVVMEADKTFTDQPKPLTIKENWDRFSKYHDKMIRHTLEDSPIQLNSTWEREGFSRNAMFNQVIPFLTGEQKAELGDVILVSDVDEIPRPEALKTLRNCDFPAQVTLRSRMYYYSFQWANRRDDWPHPQATYYEGEDTVQPDDLRGQVPEDAIYYAAWHCSYCFSTLAEMIDKVMSFSHAELNQPEFRDPTEILRRVQSGTDFFDREDSICDRVENNEDVPGFLKANPEKYAFALNRDPIGGNFRDYDRAQYGGIGT